MLSKWVKGVGCLVAVAVLTGSAMVRVHAEERELQRDPAAAPPPAVAPQEERVAPEAAKEHATRLRGDDIVGLRVRDQANENIGTINDLVINTQTGEIRYAALSFGGFLGFGDKLFAIPWDAMELKHDAERDESYISFDIDRERLREAPGFDQDNWPNVADPAWQKTVDDFHRIGRADPDATRADAPIREQAPAQVRAQTGQPDERVAERAKATLERDPHAMRHSQMKWLAIQDEQGESLGRIDDYVINVDKGKAEFVAVAFGGFLGFGDTLVAVPFEELSLREDEDLVGRDRHVMVLAMDRQLLRKAPSMGDDGYDSFKNPQFAQTMNEFFDDARVARKPGERIERAAPPTEQPERR